MPSSGLMNSTGHDPDFRQAERDWKTFVESMTQKLMDIDDTIPELPMKDIVCYPELLFETSGADQECAESPYLS